MANDQNANKKKTAKEKVEYGELELTEAPLEEDKPSYAKEFTANELETYIDDIADTVRVGLDQSISILTPWFFNNMPQIYYQTTPRQEKVRHLSSIITGHVFEKQSRQLNYGKEISQK